MSLPMIIYCTLYLIWWRYLEKTPRLHYTVIHTKVDDMIPFQEIFIIPYLLWFGYCLFTVLWFLFRKETEDYVRVLAFLGTGMTLFLIISTLFPNILHLRPEVFPRDNMLTRMVRMLYLRDTATNVFPSIHVYNAIGCHLAILNARSFTPRAKRVSAFLCVSIILSTMFLKQHSTFDVMGAMALCIVMDYVIYRSNLIKLIDFSDEFVSADRDQAPAFSGKINKVSETGKAHF